MDANDMIKGKNNEKSMELKSNQSSDKDKQNSRQGTLHPNPSNADDN